MTKCVILALIAGFSGFFVYVMLGRVNFRLNVVYAVCILFTLLCSMAGKQSTVYAERSGTLVRFTSLALFRQTYDTLSIPLLIRIIRYLFFL
jgi:hypothetical protein